jgi:hypothetical protein
MSDEKMAKSEGERAAAKPTSTERSLLEHLKDWSPTSGDVEALSPLARESLDRVIALTEYEDGKAGRVITAIALLSAAAGAVYAGMLKEVLSTSAPLDRILFNCGFFCYAAADVVGVFLLLSAIYPWFNIPDYWRTKSGHAAGQPKSMIFGPLIAEASPAEWAKAFTEKSADLKGNFLKNYILETHLIAQKIVLKYKGLRCARWFVVIANLLLLPLWLAYCLYLNIRP